MREVPYETDQDVRARSRREEMYERINDFLARGGRGRSGRSGRGRGMMKVEVMMEVTATMKKNVCFLCKCLE